MHPISILTVELNLFKGCREQQKGQMDRRTDRQMYGGTDGQTERLTHILMLGWTNVRSDKCRFFTWGRTNVRSDKCQGRTNVLFIYRSDKRRIFSLRLDKRQCVLGSDKCRGRTVGQMSVGQTSVGQKLRHQARLISFNSPLNLPWCGLATSQVFCGSN